MLLLQYFGSLFCCEAAALHALFESCFDLGASPDSLRLVKYHDVLCRRRLLWAEQVSQCEVVDVLNRCTQLVPHFAPGSTIPRPVQSEGSVQHVEQRLIAARETSRFARGFGHCRRVSGVQADERLARTGDTGQEADGVKSLLARLTNDAKQRFLRVRCVVCMGMADFADIVSLE